MKRLLSFVVVLSVVASAAVADENGWTLSRDRQNIKIHTRRIEGISSPTGSRTDEH